MTEVVLISGICWLPDTDLFLLHSPQVLDGPILTVKIQPDINIPLPLLTCVWDQCVDET